jgi:hypothetical protein
MLSHGTGVVVCIAVLPAFGQRSDKNTGYVSRIMNDFIDATRLV